MYAAKLRRYDLTAEMSTADANWTTLITHIILFFESQRDSIIQPRVASPRATLGQAQ